MITEARMSLVAQLASISDVSIDTTFERVNVPALIVRPPVTANSYVTYPESQRFEPKAFTIHLEVFVAVRAGKSAIDDLEALIDEVIKLTADSWTLESVDSIGLVNIQNADYPGTVIRLAGQFIQED